MNKVKRDNWIAFLFFCLFVASICYGLHYYKKCVVDNIKVCGRAEKVVDMTRFHKSKIYEDYVIVVKWDDGKREDISVTRMSFLSVKEGERVCFDRSIAALYVNEMHPYQRNTFISIFVIVMSLVFCIYFAVRNIDSPE